MKTQVIVATMNQKRGEYSLVDRMAIKSDSIICNQSADSDEIIEFPNNGSRCKWISYNRYGVGLNRNVGILSAENEIITFADDDMTFFPNHEEIVINEFERIRDADIILFNIDGLNENNTKKQRKIGLLNYMRYGAARISARLDSIKREGLFFNLCFGGGTQYSHGEDTLFLHECLKRGLKIYASPKTIAKIDTLRESTWFKGYDEKYFSDTGILYQTITKKFWRLLCLQDAIRHHHVYKKSAMSVYKAMTKK